MWRTLGWRWVLNFWVESPCPSHSLGSLTWFCRRRDTHCHRTSKWTSWGWKAKCPNLVTMVVSLILRRWLEIGCYSGAQAALRLTIFLSFKCWDCRHVPSCYFIPHTSTRHARKEKAWEIKMEFLIEKEKKGQETQEDLSMSHHSLCSPNLGTHPIMKVVLLYTSVSERHCN